ncbi:hypothetical protein PP639_gp067 [Arthrobacter phage Seahorse]|uniref:Helix-turn-helix DNA binding domain protein n=1 Tax=Arthrobacter phage Seahorse TaxID=2419611 RepID=A0A3G3M653_9CAUD|nr:hypothetical protein PP639_gp067 [Arthrobacter phage Seahorse]AYR01567.1 hypothetical protein PBI_SEAHORSE_67 [Arthrobacter phage Seahorse]
MNNRADLAAQAMTPEWPTRSEDFKQIRRHMARKALAMSDQFMFSNMNVARVHKKTGISLQTIHEVIRELRTEE